jgi:hypothetical protein
MNSFNISKELYNLRIKDLVGANMVIVAKALLLVVTKEWINKEIGSYYDYKDCEYCESLFNISIGLGEVIYAENPNKGRSISSGGLLLLYIYY